SKLRKIVSVDEKTGKKITLLTNIFDMDSSEIAAIYRRRWRIELFFKSIKQNVKIKKFFGQSENAVKTQIWIAMIVYLLFAILTATMKGLPRNLDVSQDFCVRFSFLFSGESQF
ncbi:MAG: transposase, partial [Treponema sp.]|nr:transposase [Treponema sp.]